MSIPLFLTFDSGISPASVATTPFAKQEVFVWGASVGSDTAAARRAAFKKANPNISLSLYMPYSRAPSASLGFNLAWFERHHPDWILYQCDRKTVAFWDGETAPTGSVPIDFTNPEVVAWQVANQSVKALQLGYDAMAFDNFGGGARQSARGGPHERAHRCAHRRRRKVAHGTGRLNGETGRARVGLWTRGAAG